MGEELLSVEERARRWVQSDPDAADRAQIEAWIDASDSAALEEAFGEALSFGTAGIRAVMGPGSARMNRATIRRISQAVALQLLDDGASSIIVGGDARRNSSQFVQDAVGVFAAAGLRVITFDRAVATPIVAFAVRELELDAGVVITASHNPPEYNGFKLYAENGAQIVPPTDTAIAQRLAVLTATPEPPLASNTRTLGGEFIERYRSRVLRGLLRPRRRYSLCVVHTALHGVGGQPMEELANALDGLEFHAVAAQREPDGAFPTVRFPNPEEPGSLDLALEEGERRQADLVLANDPDADRLAVAVRDGAGVLRLLSGNELGCVFADALLERHGAANSLVMTTVVSTRMLAKIASARGAHYAESLTGFKWIATKAMELEAREGVSFLFGFEEALGYCVGDVVRDKDGLGAAVHLLEMADMDADAGKTLLDRLHDLERAHGRHSTQQFSLRLDEPEQAAAILKRLRESTPASIGPCRVESLRDYASGLDGLPPTELVELLLREGGRILVRPSGTEAKIKFYIERIITPDTDLGDEMAALWDGLQEALS